MYIDLNSLLTAMIIFGTGLVIYENGKKFIKKRQERKKKGK